jgi:acetyl esterase/lipase
MASAENATLIASLRDSLETASITTIPEMRAWFEMTCGTFRVAPDVTCEPVTASGVPAEWIRVGAGGSTPDAAILYLHGGGYAIGSINTHRALVAELARAAAVAGLAIDYRLAPESPFPAAVEDATATYRWLLAQGIAPSRLAIAGDSAGGGLTIATLAALRDAGVPLPATAVCFSPWIDLEGIGQSMTDRASRDPLIQKEGMLTFSAAYLAGKDPRTPLAAPLYADLTGLPPLLVQVGEDETLYDDAVRLVERARKSGVDATLEAWAEMIHVWQLFAPVLPEGREALTAAGRFVGARLGTIPA